MILHDVASKCINEFLDTDFSTVICIDAFENFIDDGLISESKVVGELHEFLFVEFEVFAGVRTLEVGVEFVPEDQVFVEFREFLGVDVAVVVVVDLLDAQFKDGALLLDGVDVAALEFGAHEPPVHLVNSQTVVTRLVDRLEQSVEVVLHHPEFDALADGFDVFFELFQVAIFVQVDLGKSVQVQLPQLSVKHALPPHVLLQGSRGRHRHAPVLSPLHFMQLFSTFGFSPRFVVQQLRFHVPVQSLPGHDVFVLFGSGWVEIGRGVVGFQIVVEEGIDEPIERLLRPVTLEGLHVLALQRINALGFA